jgi:hypothetical protein
MNHNRFCRFNFLPVTRPSNWPSRLWVIGSGVRLPARTAEATVQPPPEHPLKPPVPDFSQSSSRLPPATPTRQANGSYTPLFISVGAETGLAFGIGVIFIMLAYACHAVIINFLIHGSLPRGLPVYADDIEVLFKRSQRVTWYGRVVFGLTARLGATEKQLALVRRYWLGRVIAFDSLRRQRQNQLARIHLQLATSLKPEPADKKKALSQLWTAIKYFLFLIFYLLRALFSFLFGFLFIRVTIAKLIRGKLIESKDLVLVLQAKDAIEVSAKYLKEYLTTAETFDGREELFESK